MNRYVSVVGVAAVLSGACAPSVNLDQERITLMERDRSWSQTTTDVNEFMSFFATDASVYPPGSPVVKGPDAIRATFTEMSAAPGFSLTWTPDRAEVSTAGDVAYTTGAYAMAMGGPAETGKYVTIWKKEANEWKVSEDIFNADSPGPAVQHAMVAPSALVWGDGPPGLPPGAKAAVVAGDPSQAVPFVLRATMPAGYTVPPHWHPTVENLTVLSGTVAIGMGDTADPTAMTSLPPGGFVVLPSEMRHTFVAKTAATIQVHGMGPFGITYVDPANDPRQK